MQSPILEFLATATVSLFVIVGETTAQNVGPIICPPYSGPMCYADCSTYYNRCDLRAYNCQNYVTPVRILMKIQLGTSPGPECPQACPAVYLPVCGLNYKGQTRTFGNGCELTMHNCNNPGDRYSVINIGECEFEFP